MPYKDLTKQREYVRKYQKEHPNIWKDYRDDHKEYYTEYNKQYRKTHKEQHRVLITIWRQNNRKKDRQYHKMSLSKRRNLGFNILWQPKVIIESMEYHHINKQDVVLIPSCVHEFVYHNVFSGKGMLEINALALAYIKASI